MIGADHALAWAVTSIRLPSIALLGFILFWLFCLPFVSCVIFSYLDARRELLRLRESEGDRSSLARLHPFYASRLRAAIAKEHPSFLPLWFENFRRMLELLPEICGLVWLQTKAQVVFRLLCYLRQYMLRLKFRSCVFLLPNAKDEPHVCLAQGVRKHEL